MQDGKSDQVTPLKVTMNPKNRGNFTATKDLDLTKLSPREQDLLRIINMLEEELDNSERSGAKK